MRAVPVGPHVLEITMFLTQLQSLEVPFATRLVLLALLLSLVTFDLVVGLRSHRTFAADIAPLTGTAAETRRIRLLSSWIRLGVATALATTIAVVALPGISLRQLGFAMPDLAARGLTNDTSSLAGVGVGILFGVVVAGVLVRKAGRHLPGSAAVDPMLPRTGGGRWWWAGMSLSAGVTEEIVYRGLSLLALALVLPDVPTTVLVAVSAVVFGAAHAYQGRAGVVMTGLAGWMLASLYVSTGSLLLPMIVHTLVDLRALMLKTRPEGSGAVASGAASDVATFAPRPAIG